MSGGLTGAVEPDAGGGLDLTITEQFARSMSLDDALDPRNLLCYEMNGEPLPKKNGFPIRLIAPGWYGVANVKWLTRIEVRNQRHAGNFMARDYVTIREERRNGQPLRRPWPRLGRSDRGSGSPHRQRTVAAGESLRAGGPQPEQARLGVEILDVRLGNARHRQAHSDVQGIRRRRQRAAGAGRSVPCQQSDPLGEQRTHHTPGSHLIASEAVPYCM
jgi:DMSO/TMAO reductase YedYZ molybdopterin-dependent catalytic subunit